MHEHRIDKMTIGFGNKCTLKQTYVLLRRQNKIFSSKQICHLATVTENLSKFAVHCPLYIRRHWVLGGFRTTARMSTPAHLFSKNVTLRLSLKRITDASELTFEALWNDSVNDGFQKRKCFAVIFFFFV